MEKKRMQKLAGINEGTGFKNGKFKLQRYSYADYSKGEEYEPDPQNGNVCIDEDVAKLEELAAELLQVVQMTISTSAASNLGGIGEKARKVIKKAKSL